MRSRYWILFKFLLTTTIAQNLTSVNESNIYTLCNRGLPFLEAGRTVEEYCCQIQAATFRDHWYSGGFFLSRHLEVLKTWRCPQLQEECEKRPYDFTEFTSLMYDSFCDHSDLEQRCIPVLEGLVESNQTRTISTTTNSTNSNTPGQYSGENEEVNSTWNRLVTSLDSSILKSVDLFKPCVQVAELETTSSGFGEYEELTSVNLPFCSIAWCGFSASTIKRDGGVRPYDCLSTLCQANLVIIMTVIIILAICIFLANLMVIIVFCTSSKLQNSQAIYKISMAVSDLLIGAFVLPTFAVNLFKMSLLPARVGDIITLEDPAWAEAFFDWDRFPRPGRDGLTIRTTTRARINVFGVSYQFAAGCVTFVSLVVSIYSLMFAGFDRLLAVSRPLRYRRHRARKISVRLAIGTWVVAAVLSLLPLVTELEYGLISTMLFTVIGKNSVTIYVIVFLIPLIVVWATNIAVYAMVQRQNKKRAKLTNRNANDSAEKKAENRLAITLAIIIGVFTLSALPTTIISIVPAVTTYKINSQKIYEFDPARDAVFHSADFVAAIILVCNSLWNCFIYSARNDDFKKALKALLHRITQVLRPAKKRKVSIHKPKTRTSLGNNVPSTTAISITPSANKSRQGYNPVQKPSPTDLEISENEDLRVPSSSSIFSSFTWNVNADRFFGSVMRKFRHNDLKRESNDDVSVCSASRPQAKSRFDNEVKLESIYEARNATIEFENEDMITDKKD